jgi:hypothetical protein
MAGSKQKTDKGAAAAAREARLADALKANLKRRKAQARARPNNARAGDASTGPDER